MKKFERSNNMLDRTRQIIPVCSQTFSKGYRYFPVGASPLFLRSGHGCKVVDLDQNVYIDYILGLGPITLGYRYDAVDDAIYEQLASNGIVFSQPSDIEYQLAKLLTDIIPGCEMARFFKTGTEACAASIRIARAFTRRDKILSYGYHGWDSNFAVVTERKKGIPLSIGDNTLTFEYNNIDSVKKAFDENHDQIACVIMEPVIGTVPENDFLHNIQDLCKKNSAVLIFDEVVTGFRWSLGGAGEYFGITPDISVFGKGMGNGMPINAVCGRSDIMNEFEDVMVSSTFGGECLSIAAALATIREMKKKNTIAHCWAMGKRLRAGLEKVGMRTQGYDCRPALILPDDQKWKSLLLERLIEHGVMVHLGGLINICYSHGEREIDDTIKAFGVALTEIKNGATLAGKIAYPSFRRV